MGVFGKELNMEMDYKNKIRLIYLATFILVIVMFIFMIINPFKHLQETKKTLESEQARLVKIKEKFEATQKRREDVMDEFERQKERYAILKVQFEQATHQNNATFKREIQDVMDYLGVKVSSIGAPEIAPKKQKPAEENDKDGKAAEKEEYQDDELKYEKKYFAYNVSGPAPEVSTFFYYLENSKRLITLKNGATNITKSGQNDLNASFKIGTYFFEEEGDENE